MISNGASPKRKRIANLKEALSIVVFESKAVADIQVDAPGAEVANIRALMVSRVVEFELLVP